MRVAQLQWWLRPSWSLLLAQNVGHIISSECASIGCLLDGCRDRLGTILAHQLEQLGQLASQGAIGICYVAEVGFNDRVRAKTIQRIEQTLLRLRAPCRRPLLR